MSKTVRAQLSAQKQALNQAETRARTQAVGDARHLLHTTVNSLAREHRRSKRWASTQMYIPDRRKRAPSAWNGFVREKLQEANKDLPVGTRQVLAEFLRARNTELRAEYSTLSAQQRELLVRNLQIVPEKCVKVIRDSPRANCRRVTAGFNKLRVMLTSLVAITGLELIVVGVRGQYKDINKAEVFCTPRMEDFVEDALGMTPEELAMKADGYSVSGLRLGARPTSDLPRGTLVSKCRKQIQSGLQTIINSARKSSYRRKTVMNYENYERRIVEKHSVALIGWPLEKVTNPGFITTQVQLALVACALESGKCKWVKLSATELSARVKRNVARQHRVGDVYKSRKKTTKGAKSAATIEDTEDEEEGV
ncbi:hypothetical protein BDN72DRAFT_901014 [Pluteus cervinus]|uniref:Uncharacterized protein n=1 Tax=Pluteus cervinus TaxID=181527 RepID=A0ACD3AI44_9AGAR|nr:hypothetical protein BDN72DRAFT_901014 [Pluteus cervinus]